MRAYMNHGRWVADCECGGAEKVHPDGQIQVNRDGIVYGIGLDGRMVCGSCGEESAVEFPDDMLLIESAVAARRAHNRNWAPGETVAGLLAENVDHGLAVA